MSESQYTPDQEREGLKRILKAIDQEDLKKYQKKQGMWTILWLAACVVLAARFHIDAVFIVVMMIAYVQLIRIDDRITLLRRRTKRFSQQPIANSEQHD